MGSAAEYARLVRAEETIAALQARLDDLEARVAHLPARPPLNTVKAANLLEDALRQGPLPFREVWRRAQAAGVPLRSLRRAKAKLGVRSARIRQDHGRYVAVWAPPA